MTEMHRAGLRIDLKTPAIFSVAAATTGGHASLDGIPGSALLGLAASWQDLWQEYVGEPVWTVLRSGIVRFGPGFLIDAIGRVLLPVPRSLHTIKASTEGSLVASSILYNLAGGARKEGRQFEQLREGFLAETETGLKKLRSRKAFVMKTAVDPDKGTAMDAMLFGYEALAADQSFYAEIEADAELLDAQAFEDIVMSLAGPKGREHRVGRSRSAEFGSVKISRVHPKREDKPARLLNDKLVLWALSDIALVDGNGQPTLDPMTADLGLADLDYCPEESFLGTRRYTPYVGRWRCSDVERQVIAAGSVLVFKGPGAERAATRLHAVGIGVDRAAGLGTLWVNPPCLDGPELSQLPEWYRLPMRQPDEKSGAAPKNNPLYEWLETRAGTRRARDGSDNAVNDAAAEIIAAYRSAEAYSGLRPDGLAGPSRSQWNQVASIARKVRGASDLLEALFGSKGLIVGADPAWGWQVEPNRNHGDVLKRQIKNLEASSADAPRVVASTAQRVAAQVGGAIARRTVSAEREKA